MTQHVMRPLVARGVIAALKGATAHGVLDALERPLAATDLAERLDLSPRALELVLGVLAALGLIEQRDGRYTEVEHGELAQSIWRGMEAFMRSGEVTAGIDAPDQRGAFYQPTVTALGEVFRAPASELAAMLPAAATILDVGAGSGVWSLAMAARSERTRVSGLDLDEVVGCFEEAARSLGLSDRARLVAGDYFTASFDTPFERILLANVLHLESPANATALIGRYAAQLTEDGELVIVDFFGEEGGFEAELVRAVYALHLGMRTAVGKPHALSELGAFCAEAGLTHRRLLPLSTTGGAIAALVARRPPVRTSRQGQAPPVEGAGERSVR